MKVRPSVWLIECLVHSGYLFIYLTKLNETYLN